jgi:hypothetical protein
VRLFFMPDTSPFPVKGQIGALPPLTGMDGREKWASTDFGLVGWRSVV